MASSAASFASVTWGGSGRSGGVDASKDGEGRLFAEKNSSTLRVFCSMMLESSTILLGAILMITTVEKGRVDLVDEKFESRYGHLKAYPISNVAGIQVEARVRRSWVHSLGREVRLGYAGHVQVRVKAKSCLLPRGSVAQLMHVRLKACTTNGLCRPQKRICVTQRRCPYCLADTGHAP